MLAGLCCVRYYKCEEDAICCICERVTRVKAFDNGYNYRDAQEIAHTMYFASGADGMRDEAFRS